MVCTVKKYDSNIICPNCGYNLSTITDSIDESGRLVIGICKKCRKGTYRQFTKADDISDLQASELQGINLIQCPFCQSTNCKKISGASKIGKVALFGVFAAGSVSKTWHCNNCGSNFG